MSRELAVQRIEVVAAAQTPMVMWVYAAVIVLCLISFRSWRGALCVIVPLVVVSYLGYALKYYLNIGLKTSTLPVIALGVGIGVVFLAGAVPEVMLHLRDLLVEGIQHDFARIAAGAPMPALGEGAVCDYCAARGLCRKDFWND